MTIHDLLRAIEDQRERAIYTGINPTEAWLGPDEYAVLAAEIRRPGGILHPHPKPELGTPQVVAGLRIRQALEPGVRVGVTFPLPEGARPVRASGAMPADLRAFCGKGGGD